MSRLIWLAAIPVLLAIGSFTVANRVAPFILGMPFFMAWVVGSVLITSLVMWVIYLLDPANES